VIHAAGRSAAIQQAPHLTRQSAVGMDSSRSDTSPTTLCVPSGARLHTATGSMRPTSPRSCTGLPRVMIPDRELPARSSSTRCTIGTLRSSATAAAGRCREAGLGGDVAASPAAGSADPGAVPTSDDRRELMPCIRAGVEPETTNTRSKASVAASFTRRTAMPTSVCFSSQRSRTRPQYGQRTCRRLKWPRIVSTPVAWSAST